jgi:hypothetical protein
MKASARICRLFEAIPIMTNENDLNSLQKIKTIHGRVTIIAGVIMGVALSSYFFTFGMLIDAGKTAILWFQLITMILFIFGLIFLKRLALFLTRLLLAYNADCRRLIKGMKVTDLEKI